jgi:Fur family peroxide stress response transcriptional regulator
VTTVRPRQARVRYDANMDAHHHFVCTRCSATLDFKYADFDAMKVPDAAKALGRVESRHVELRGLCASCWRNDDHRTNPSTSKSIHHPRRKFHE